MAILTCSFLVLIIPYAASITFDFPNINQTLQNEFKVDIGAYVSDMGIQVTPETRRLDRGRATYRDPLHLWDKTSRQLASFDTEFSFIIDSVGNRDYADGLTFCLAENNTLITMGGAIGLPVDAHNHTKIHDFVAVEFDTFGHNSWDPKDISVYEKHVGIDVNSLYSVESQQWTNNVSAGEKSKAYIKYDSNSYILSVMVYNNISDLVVELNHIIDLRDVLPEWVIFGFSASTGDLFEKNTVTSWKFNSSILHVDEEEVKPPITSPNNSSSSTPSKSSDQKSKNKTGLMVGIIAGAVVTFLAILAFFLCWRKKKKQEKVQEAAEGVEMNKDFELGTGARKFSYQELVKATAGFVERNKLGEGGFGGVYKGCLKDVDTYIAVKRVSKTSEQGIKEYESEVKIISRLRHRNLVQLNGWCHEKGELLLVYEFMENGSLDLHLFERKSLLSWGTRYKIAHGLASALLYLHNEWEQCVLHRDIKSSNVMLDSCFNAKLGDFGLARLVDHEKGSQTTKLAGTMGYMAPEYLMSGKASKETDVFSFGVVALEIASGRKPIYSDGSETKTELVEWVWDLHGTATLLEAVDRGLGSDFVEEEIKRLMVVGLWCAHPDPIARPSMRQAIQVLKFEASPPILPLKMPAKTYYVPSTSTSNGTTSSGCDTVSSKLATS